MSLRKKMKRQIVAVSMAAGFALAGATGAIAADAPFYAGKTVTFIVGLGAGGSTDLACRLIAQYMGAHVAGNPTIIVKNMPGADTVIATNYVGAESKKDGLTMLCGTFATQSQLSHNANLKVDLTKFDYIAGDGLSSVFYARSDVPPGIKTGADLFKATGLVMGGLAVDSTKDIHMRLLFQMLGINDYHYVTGFPGGAQGRAALQQKFINFWGEDVIAYNTIVKPTMVDTGEVVPLFQAGKLDDSEHLTLRDPRVPDVQTIPEFYQAHFGKPPAGPAWELAELILGYNVVAVHGILLPPGSPPEAVAAMEAAVQPLNQDPAFSDASDKLRGIGVKEVPGNVVLAELNRLLNMNPTLQSLWDSTIKSGEAMAERK